MVNEIVSKGDIVCCLVFYLSVLTTSQPWHKPGPCLYTRPLVTVNLRIPGLVEHDRASLCWKPGDWNLGWVLSIDLRASVGIHLHATGLAVHGGGLPF